ncbi:unnamed protein product [Cercopithifilaria johnstoni]|uniref:Uncharacterized protein n=1 Tax=Cercopithifilaria johnstoni TaxID=2874296 RepID=A0A8J2PY36_9BILA|nr:unnamed protein product [Cercopithifilaria johnstoni]
MFRFSHPNSTDAFVAIAVGYADQPIDHFNDISISSSSSSPPPLPPPSPSPSSPPATATATATATAHDSVFNPLLKNCFQQKKAENSA